jgi:N-acyl-D-amino-acid deacylase
MLDLVIKNGIVVDGTGAPGRRGGIAVKDGRIAAVGDVQRRAERVIDAEGMVIAPGFLDIHTHYDAQLTWDPLATSSCWQGVTSVLVGNCGYSIAPCKPGDRDFLMSFFSLVEGVPASMLKSGLPWSWETVPQFMDALDKRLGVNVMVMVGHSPLRYYHMGMDAHQRAATEAELQAMKRSLAEAMAAGAFGFTTNRYFERGHTKDPIPSRMATEEELFDLSSALGEARAGFVEIIPESFMWGPVAKDREMLERLALHCRRPVIWNQFAHTWEAPSIWREVVEWHREANARGARVYALNQNLRFDLRFPLTEPRMFWRKVPWRNFLSAPLEERGRLWNDPATREELRSTLLVKDPELTFIHLMDILYVNQAKTEANRQYLNRSVEEIARSTRRHPADVLVEIGLNDNWQTEMEFRGVFGGDEEAQAEIIKDPYSIAGESDGGAHCVSHVGTGFGTHLLSHWVRERGIMPMEEAVRRLTSMPAQAVGLKDRGTLREGLAADVVVFDPATVGPGEKRRVNDFPGGEARLVQYAAGIKATLVNGRVLVMDGQHEGDDPGRVLRSTQYRD